MKKLIKEFKFIAKYYDEGMKDIFNQKILSRYAIDCDGNEIFTGYKYMRSKKEIKRLKKVYGKNVGIQEFTDCPLENVVGK